jgi:superfamily II DNA helicase RecQ
MQIQIFNFPAFTSQYEIDEMNKFLRTNRIIDVEKHFVESPDGSFWTFCVRYIEGPNHPVFERKEKIDYKSVLDEQTFSRFIRLRDIRKEIAEKDAVPAYAVFTDAELAEIAGLSELSFKNMLSVKGIGLKKVEKYGEAMSRAFFEKGS